MIRQVVDFGKQILVFTRDVQQCKADIQELQQQVAAITEEQNLIRGEFRELVHVVELLAMQLETQRREAAREREVLVLRLENALLRIERGLPTGPLVGGEPDLGSGHEPDRE